MWVVVNWRHSKVWKTAGFKKVAQPPSPLHNFCCCWIWLTLPSYYSKLAPCSTRRRRRPERPSKRRILLWINLTLWEKCWCLIMATHSIMTQGNNCQLLFFTFIVLNIRDKNGSLPSFVGYFVICRMTQESEHLFFFTELHWYSELIMWQTT